MKSTMAVGLFVLLSITCAGPAAAKGCVSGAAVGGVAGHVAGHHAVIGAVAGCAINHHRNKVHDSKAAAAQQAQSTQGAVQPAPARPVH
jgi:hypothetical protein